MQRWKQGRRKEGKQLNMKNMKGQVSRTLSQRLLEALHFWQARSEKPGAKGRGAPFRLFLSLSLSGERKAEEEESLVAVSEAGERPLRVKA